MAEIEQKPSIIKAVAAATLSSAPQPATLPSSDEPPAKRARNSIGAGAETPEPGSVKYFVGQIPKSFDEERLKPIFEEFGPVHQLSVIKNKANNASKGCCFLTFHKREDGAAAQRAMHNSITLPGMNHPVQMKPADSEKRNVEERKLFIGMLSKKQTEQDVMTMFAPYGDIDECAVLRDGAGNSKGCAFITYATKHSAMNAIRSMHESSRMEGCTSTIKVRLADTPRDKEKRQQSGGANSRWGSRQDGGMQPLMSSNYGVQPQQASYGSGSNMPMTNSVQQQPQQGAQQLLGNNVGALALAQLITGLVQAASGQQQPSGDVGALGGIVSALTGQQAAGYQASAPAPAAAQVNSGYAGLAASNGTSANGVASVNPQPVPPPQAQSSYANTAYGATSYNYGATSSTEPGAGKNVEGPEGANLFIYHLPQDFNDNNLAQTFAPFGKVISAKVFVDHKTNLSKCFGFVSYDNAASAQKAISAMNGFEVGQRRLRVQLKKPKS